MMFLIKDLDNPFGYYQNGSVENISINAIEDLEKRISPG